MPATNSVQSGRGRIKIKVKIRIRIKRCKKRDMSMMCLL